MAWLSLLLFLPWFGLIGTLYWCYPRRPRPRARRLFDAAVLALALVLSVAGMHWGYAEGVAHAGAGPIWRQVLAVLYAYGAFLAVLALAVPWRMRLLAGRWSGHG
ncbi:hypothetical protein B1992_09750 [Pseudoxanthomonas broegbernensis]|uniref:Transmembrane protein n=1 Tax=Pseudoxanthomonas broegbernensis TaxID=83619 RepID=A0A7V8GLN3_9GAMM|nr:hypothetical protein [Pseudoxanthomonas broegbernensis]KAF1685980.1 hypothetical protein B1992_09750 [Pseudoxanthomonas broegbernensis]MBB6063766.1 hypothetical protein [Pseudoxanthomonas broegbernensis]